MIHVVRRPFAWFCALFCSVWTLFSATPASAPSELDPKGRIHLPIGIPNRVDTLKTFVEAEGNFSPGFGSFGVYFQVLDRDAGRLYAPTMENVPSQHGLPADGSPLPWTRWRAGLLVVQTEVCQTERGSGARRMNLVGSRVTLSNAELVSRRVSLYVTLRPVGAAGWPIRSLAAAPEGDAFLLDGHCVLVATPKPTAIGATNRDTVAELVLRGEMPADQEASSKLGECSGAMRFDFTVGPRQTRVVHFVCPVLPGRRAAPHHWDGRSEWAQFDEAKLNAEEGTPQPDPGARALRGIKVDDLFEEAAEYWAKFLGRTQFRLPDPRWTAALRAMTAHAALNLNEDAPDVAVVNYNVFNRDAVYLANMLHKMGQFELAGRAVDYLLGQPFNGRVEPEADNPGQVLWIAGEHWLFTRDRKWLERAYPSVRKLAEMIQYYRTTPGPHWVARTGLAFGAEVPVEERMELKPGRCDGFHPEYTEAFDIAGLRSAVLLAELRGDATNAMAWEKLSAELAMVYEAKFGGRLAEGYGSYSVLWPCRLYPLDAGRGREQFQGVGAQSPAGWRYFPLARAHQGLLAGNREAGHLTVNRHLDHEQMRGWFAFDEGGDSGVGGWNNVLTRWKQGRTSVAMPHGWAIAEMHLLLRDSLVLEDKNRLVLFAGIPAEWYRSDQPIEMLDLATSLGRCSIKYRFESGQGELSVEGLPPSVAVTLRVPVELGAEVLVQGKPVESSSPGEYRLPAGARRAQVRLAKGPVQGK